MTSNLDIYRTASAWIARHGDHAHPMALSMAEIFASRGEPEGEAIWKRIAAAVEELQRQEPGEGESVN